MTSLVLARAVEENPREFFRTMMRKEFQSTRKADWIISGVPIAFLNSVIRTEFPKSAVRDIKRMVAKFDSVSSPMTWRVSPSTRPKNLGDQLLANGFKLEESVPAMALRLNLLRRTEYPEGLEVRPIRNQRELMKWLAAWAKIFEIPEEARESLYRFFLRKGYSADSDVLNYMGLLRGRLVAVSTLFLGKIAGIYNVGTVASARGGGIGSAMTHFALAEARRRGFGLATLQSSKAGYGVYSKLGFKEYFKLSNYVRVRH